MMETDGFATYRHPWELGLAGFLAAADRADSAAAQALFAQVEAIGGDPGRQDFSCVRDLLGGWGLKRFAVVALRPMPGDAPGDRLFCLLHKDRTRPIGAGRGGLVWIAPEYRGQGLATAMVLAAARSAGDAPVITATDRRPVADAAEAAGRVWRAAHRVSCRMAIGADLQVPRDNRRTHALPPPAGAPRSVRAASTLDWAKSLLVPNLDQERSSDMMRLPNGDRLTKRSGAQYLQTMLPEGRLMAGAGGEFLLYHGMALDLSPSALGQQPILLDAESPLFEKRYGNPGRIRPVDRDTLDPELDADRSIFMSL